MATLNEQGINYNWTAMADDSFDYGMLSEVSVFKIDEIERLSQMH